MCIFHACLASKGGWGEGGGGYDVAPVHPTYARHYLAHTMACLAFRGVGLFSPIDGKYFESGSRRAIRRLDAMCTEVDRFEAPNVHVQRRVEKRALAAA